ncbi:MAG: efflux transporter outer membrane subunit [Betaproteobacteria bacterium]|nr:efflux transporter outer membrane subunit [Betaproteobacteria bacterium]
MRLPIALIALIALLLLGACAGREAAVRPQVEMPPQWLGAPPSADAGLPDERWWSSFRSAELERLIDLALANSHDLRAAAARIDQARANLVIAGAPRFPSIFAAGDASRSRRPGEDKSRNAFSVSALAAYEVDLWGRIREEGAAAAAQLESSQFAWQTLRLTLIGDVGTVYFQILSLQDRLRVAEAGLANARRVLDLTELQRSAGKVSMLEVARQRNLVAATQATLPPLRRQLQANLDALHVLLGENPGEISLQASSLKPLALPGPRPGLPAELLTRRPDLRKAEADLAQAHANLAAARAALLPSFSLSLDGGYVNAALSRLFDPGRHFYSLGASLLATIFDGGRLGAQRDLAEARQRELVEAYRQAILSALRDVEDALAALRELEAQEEAEMRAVDEARRAYELAELRYKSGAIDFTSLLDAQRALLNAEATLEPTRFARFAGVVSLYKALGGGWAQPPSPAAALSRR